MVTRKKATNKKTSVKKVAPKRTASKKTKKVVVESFKLSPESYPFISFRITDQTVYWSILLIMILVLALWVLRLHVSIYEILDSINVTI